MITGKAKEDFQEWLFKNNSSFTYAFGRENAAIEVSEVFEDLPAAMKWGVYVDFFDSKEIFITDKSYGRFEVVKPGQFHFAENLKEEAGARKNARKRALEVACEIYNSVKAEA
ncbi:MAG: hypothetical protein WBL21_06035 [Salinimicrobium sp.]